MDDRPKRDKHVLVAVKLIEEKLQTLEGHIDQLYADLSQVLCGTNSECATEKKVTENICPLHSSLDSISDNISGVSNSILDIMDRLEV